MRTYNAGQIFGSWTLELQPILQVTSLIWQSQTTLFSVQSYRVINKVINFKKENKHLPILVAKRSREIMVVKFLMSNMADPVQSWGCREHWELNLVPRVFYTALCPRQKLAVVTLELFSKSPVGEIALGCGSGFWLRSCLRLQSDQLPKGKAKLELGLAWNTVAKVSQEQKPLIAEVHSTPK